MNKLIDGLVSDLRQRFSIESAGMTTGEWVCQNTTFKNQPFSFEGYEFQRAIMDDLHPNLDVIKISQVGLTEIQMRKACALLARNNGMVGLFSLAEERMYRKFSQTRLGPFIEENKVFHQKGTTAGVKSIDTVQIGQSFLHIVNAVEAAATSTSADFLFNDEVDLSDQKVLALFASRLQNSDWKIKQRFSTPSWVGFGIDGTYAVSDQREFYSKCVRCNHYQVPMFSEDFVKIRGLPLSCKLVDITDEMMDGLDLRNVHAGCERCDARLELESLNREWIASFPSRQGSRGYRVRPFSTPRISVAYIIQSLLDYRRQDYIRGWYNTVIGEPFTDSQARLDEAQIKAVMTSEAIPQITPGKPCCIGIDMGLVCHITLGTSQGCFMFLAVKSSEVVSKVHELLGQYNIVSGCVDIQPYTPTSEEIRDISQGRIMPIMYGTGPDLRPVKDPTGFITHWQANRTKSLDEVVKSIRTKSVEYAGYGVHARVLIEHLRDMVRQETPEKPAIWEKLTGNDHYFHSLGYLGLAQKLPGVLSAINEDEDRSNIFISSLIMPKQRGLLKPVKRYP